MVARAVAVEDHGAVGEKRLTGVGLDAEGLREDHRWEDLAEVAHGVKAPAGDELVSQSRRLGVEDRLEGAERLRRHDAGDEGPVAGVDGRVDLEQDARLAPCGLLGDVCQADPCGRGEVLVVPQDGMYLFVAGGGIDAVCREQHHGPGVAEVGQVGEGVREELVAEGVDVDRRRLEGACRQGAQALTSPRRLFTTREITTAITSTAP
jgi:hypothetical protein